MAGRIATGAARGRDARTALEHDARRPGHRARDRVAAMTCRDAAVLECRDLTRARAGPRAAARPRRRVPARHGDSRCSAATARARARCCTSWPASPRPPHGEVLLDGRLTGRTGSAASSPARSDCCRRRARTRFPARRSKPHWSGGTRTSTSGNGKADADRAVARRCLGRDGPRGPRGARRRDALGRRAPPARHRDRAGAGPARVPARRADPAARPASTSSTCCDCFRRWPTRAAPSC